MRPFNIKCPIYMHILPPGRPYTSVYKVQGIIYHHKVKYLCIQGSRDYISQRKQRTLFIQGSGAYLLSIQQSTFVLQGSGA